jgi:hypothetical protein
MPGQSSVRQRFCCPPIESVKAHDALCNHMLYLSTAALLVAVSPRCVPGFIPLQRDGGQLALYSALHSSCSSSSSPEFCSAEPAGYLAGEAALLVAPRAGRLLVFDARLPHEVLPAQRHRYSISAFFYRAQQQGTQTAGPAAVEAEAAEPATAEPAEPMQQAAVQLAGAAALPKTASEHGQADDCNDAAKAASTAAVQHGIGTPSSSDSKVTSQPRIFVSIAAFRDEECQWTLRDMFLQAAHPERVFAGVVWQVDPQADQAFTRMAGGQRTAPYQQQVSIVVWWRLSVWILALPGV